MKKRLIYIIRHGETEYNRLGIVQGSGINEPLNEKGIWQANRFFESYKKINFTKIYTSKLIRTQQTIQPFINAGHEFEAHAGLNEISWGIFEGKKQKNSFDVGYFRHCIRYCLGISNFDLFLL